MRITNTPAFREIPTKPLTNATESIWTNAWESARTLATTLAAGLTTCGVYLQHLTAGQISQQEQLASRLKATELHKLEESCTEKTLEYMDKSLDRFQHVGKAEQEIA